MSRLEELISSMCPDGVEYKRFDEVCTLNARIGWQRLTKREYRTSGEYLLVTGTDFTSSNTVNFDTCVYVTEDRYEQDKKIQLQEGDILITKDGTLGKVAQVIGLPKPATLNGGVFVVRPKEDNLEKRYILHYLLSSHFQKVVEQQKTGSTISHLTQRLFSRLRIPVPPIDIQREIVKTLDEFTGLISELLTSLSSEYDFRKKQSSYYCNALFVNNSRAKWVELSEIADIGTGSSNTKEAEENGEYPFYVRSQEPLRKNTFEYDETAIITAGDGVGVGKVFHFVEGKYALHQRAYRIHVNTSDIMPKYCYYYMKNAFYDYITQNMYQGSVASIRRPMLNKFPVPVVPLEEQMKIIDAYDKLENLGCEITDKIQAEINLREKQYNYYRDLFLAFKEAV